MRSALSILVLCASTAAAQERCPAFGNDAERLACFDRNAAAAAAAEATRIEELEAQARIAEAEARKAEAEARTAEAEARAAAPERIVIPTVPVRSYTRAQRCRSVEISRTRRVGTIPAGTRPGAILAHRPERVVICDDGPIRPLPPVGSGSAAEARIKIGPSGVSGDIRLGIGTKR